MRKRDLLRRIKQAREAVKKEISANASHSRLAGGLSGEGFNGGYLAALNDLELLIGDVEPSRNRWWDEREIR